MSDFLDVRTPAHHFDSALSWKVASERDAHVEYVVELDSYSGNGECVCDHFQMRLRPLLARGVTPEQAVLEKLVKPKADARDALRCKHVIEARRMLTDATIKAFAVAKRAQGIDQDHP